MGGGDAHIAHDEVRTGKDLGINALQNEAIFAIIVQRDQEGAVDIAAAEFPDVKNPPLKAELLCDTEKFFQKPSSRYRYCYPALHSMGKRRHGQTTEIESTNKPIVRIETTAAL